MGSTTILSARSSTAGSSSLGLSKRSTCFARRKPERGPEIRCGAIVCTPPRGGLDRAAGCRAGEVRGAASRMRSRICSLTLATRRLAMTALSAPGGSGGDLGRRRRPPRGSRHQAGGQGKPRELAVALGIASRLGSRPDPRGGAGLQWKFAAERTRLGRRIPQRDSAKSSAADVGASACASRIQPESKKR